MSFEYDGMPQGDDWMDFITHAGMVDGKDGFERRLVDDLAAVGVRAFTVGRLKSAVRSVPPAIPVFIDWLNNLDSRVPGEETRHRSGLRTSLIMALDDPAAKGDRAAVDALFHQLDRRSPPLARPVQIWATEVLGRIATKDDYERMLALTRRADLEDGTRIALVRYLGRFRRAESRELARSYLERPIVRQEAIHTLGKVGTSDDIDAIAAYANDDNPRVRRAAETALKKLRS